MSGSSPFRQQPTAYPQRAAGPFANLGDYINRGFQAYTQRWQDWLAPMLVAGAIGVASYMCLFIPFLIVAGPLGCGLHACGLCSLRGQQFRCATLWQGWDVTGSAIVAYIAKTVLMLLPMLLGYGLFFGGGFFLLGMAGGLGPTPAAPDADVALGVLIMVGFGGLCMLAFLGGMVCIWWLGVRTMFVLPLIVDRRLDFLTAWGMSWEATRHGFWELLVLQFLASLLGTIGIYACYVGVIFSLPLLFLMVGAAYEHRFAYDVEVVGDPAAK